MVTEKRPFLVLWTLAVLASTVAFCTYLAMRARSIEIGYDLGRSHAQLSRLREVQRVLLVERASLKNPERVDRIARTLLGMSEPSADRVLSAGTMPTVQEEEEDADQQPRAELGGGTRP